MGRIADTRDPLPCACAGSQAGGTHSLHSVIAESHSFPPFSSLPPLGISCWNPMRGVPRLPGAPPLTRSHPLALFLGCPLPTSALICPHLPCVACRKSPRRMLTRGRRAVVGTGRGRGETTTLARARPPMVAHTTRGEAEARLPLSPLHAWVARDPKGPNVLRLRNHIRLRSGVRYSHRPGIGAE